VITGKGKVEKSDETGFS